MDPFELQPKPDRRRQARQSRQPQPITPASTFWSGLRLGMIIFVMLAALGLGVGLITYASIASTLPGYEKLTDPQWLREQGEVSGYQSMRILDRNGTLLNEIFNPDQGSRTEVPISKISKYLQDATIAVEDANFYTHNGIDFYALARALYYAVLEGDLVSGGSTIPQQLVKSVFLSAERSVTRKVREAILAAEISREYPKEKILELYLNRNYYGNFAYGAEAAAEIYFHKSVADLTLAEAAMLAGLPQAPSYYDPYTQKGRAEKRMSIVLSLMVENGFISAEQADEAWQNKPTFFPLKFDIKAPHFTVFVRQQLEERFGAAEIYQLGYKVYTTVDLKLQEEAQRIVKEQVTALNLSRVSNGALVSIDPKTGEILALVGSADFDDPEIDGQVNMALTPRQPGSTMKPLVYLAAFENPSLPTEQRWTPGTLVADILEAFPDGVNPPYVPTNYDKKERGMLTLRAALANSLNIPAVRGLQTVGVPNLLNLTQRLGISTLDRPDYGLALSLGAGEVPLLEMTGAFAVIANGGVRKPPVTLLKIVKPNGEIVCEQGTETPCQGAAGPGEQVISAVDAFLLTDILSDNEARTPIFGANSQLKLNRPAAAKTGTTNDIRDILTLGFTPQLVTGVWVGNADNSPMVNVSGVSGAAPIWNQFMALAHADKPVEEFIPPPGVKRFEVCADTGTEPSTVCPEKRTRWFAEDRPPLKADKDLYQMVKLDRTTGKLATEFTPPEAIEERAFKIYPEAYRKWAEEHGIAQPPTDPSDVFTFPPEVIIRSPVEGETLSGVISLFGTANVPDFANWEVQYGVSHDPGAFSAPISGPFDQPILDGPLGSWDTNGLGEGPHTLRLVVRDRSGHEYEDRVSVFVVRPTEVPTVEPSPTWTQTPIAIDTPTTVVIPTDTPIVLPTDTPIVPPVVTDTPTFAALPTDTPIPAVETPTVEAPTAEAPTAEPTVNTSGSDTFFFPRLRAIGDLPGALLTGTLVWVDRCLRVQSDSSGTSYLVLWPNAATTQFSGDGTLQITVNAGQVVGQVGLGIRLSGGELPADQQEFARTLIESDEVVLNSCAGPYWVTGNEMGLQ